MNKNPLSINSNLPKWETPSIYSVEIDKMMMQSEGVSTEDVVDEGGSGGKSVVSPCSTNASIDDNPFDYNSFDENPFAE